MARKSRGLYKLVNVMTKDMGSAGGQILLGYVDKLDAQGVTGYLNNVVVSAIINNYDGGDTTPGIMVYATTGMTWDDDFVITAKAMAIGGTVSLSCRRSIKFDAAKTTGNIGTVYLWAELTDITIADDLECRFVFETWGRFVEFTEVED